MNEIKHQKIEDIDAVHNVDIAVYPDSDKLGVWGKGINKIFPQS